LLASSSARCGAGLSAASHPYTVHAVATAEDVHSRSDGVVGLTDGLYEALFTAAVGYAVLTAAWGLVIAPFNRFRAEHTTSLVVGVAVLALAIGAFAARRRLFVVLRREPAWLVGVAVLGVAVLWTDGGWRSSYYLVSYAAILLAAVVAGMRWALLCALLLAAGYVSGLGVHGYSWQRLTTLRDADSAVANTGGYFIAAAFFCLPIERLGGYVARVHQTLSAHGVPAPRRRLRTRHLSVREVQVVQLAADGLSNEEIAARLGGVSPRTIQTHMANALKKSGTRTRADLGVLAVREGLVPLDPEMPRNTAV